MCVKLSSIIFRFGLAKIADYGYTVYMNKSEIAVSRCVKTYMAIHSFTQAQFAAELNISESALSKRLNGVARWQLDDLDCLIRIGVPIGLEIFGAAVRAEYSREG